MCRTSCIGEKCLKNRDCGGPGEFCNTNTTDCEKSGQPSSEKTLPGWFIPVVSAGSILLVIAILVCGYFCCSKENFYEMLHNVCSQLLNGE